MPLETGLLRATCEKAACIFALICRISLAHCRLACAVGRAILPNIVDICSRRSEDTVRRFAL